MSMTRTDLAVVESDLTPAPALRAVSAPSLQPRPLPQMRRQPVAPPPPRSMEEDEPVDASSLPDPPQASTRVTTVRMSKKERELILEAVSLICQRGGRNRPSLSRFIIGAAIQKAREEIAASKPAAPPPVKRPVAGYKR